jgi:hypothetical protein
MRAVYYSRIASRQRPLFAAENTDGTDNGWGKPIAYHCDGWKADPARFSEQIISVPSVFSVAKKD